MCGKGHYSARLARHVLSEVVAVDVDEKYIDKKNAFHMEDAKLIAYSHGDYMSLGKKLGDFGFSVRKKPRH